ncbi:MAG: hypothetical protein HEQ40_10750 [Lacibacter sp.]|jgi:hypothetical protein
MGISEVILKPIDCILALSIPCSKKSFVKNLNSGHEIDFTKRNLLRMHEHEFVKPTKKTIKSISNKGVQIFFDFTFNDLTLVLKNEFKVLFLFAHNINDRIELYDGLYDIATIMDCMPNDKVFILDLNVCFCDNLALLIGANRTNILVKYGQVRKTIPLYWILFYEYFFELINQRQLNYFDAMQITFNKFSKI